MSRLSSFLTLQSRRALNDKSTFLLSRQPLYGRLPLVLPDFLVLFLWLLLISPFGLSGLGFMTLVVLQMNFAAVLRVYLRLRFNQMPM